MSYKLYPPYIEGKIPAQTGETLIIPYQMNRAVGIGEFNTIKAKIRTVSTDEENKIIDSVEFTESTVSFDAGDLNLQIGQFYKIQLAYDQGYWSTVGIFKYTSQPTIAVEGLSLPPLSNAIRHEYKGIFENSDESEKQYSYSFSLYSEGNLIYATGELPHTGAYDVAVLPINLTPEITHELIYEVTTMNNLVTSISYQVVDSVLNKVEISLPKETELVTTANFEEGYVSISLVPPPDSQAAINGQFRLLRWSDKEYDIIDTFTLATAFNAPIHLYDDFSVQQGVEYQYAIQQFGDSVLSNALSSEQPIIADFEDMFLYDGERQLKLRFNPKVSSFKTTVFESKLDTLGGRFPFFFKNGNTNYKEFPISALISMLVDDNESFASWKHEEDCQYTNLVARNLRYEREFKLKVMEWLMNGKPKLFRSPGEGNYVVRLMNITLSPNDTLGRMLHTFNAQAYEIADSNFAKLMELGLVKGIDSITSNATVQQTILTEESSTLGGISATHMVVFAQPGSKMRLGFADNTSADIEIGSTMVYEVPVQTNNPVAMVTLLEGSNLTVQYDGTYPVVWKSRRVTSVVRRETAAQFIGEQENIVSSIIENATDFNIMALTLSAIPGYSEDDYWAKIVFEGEEETATFNLGPNLLEEQLNNILPNGWKKVGFGGLNMTCKSFKNNLFRPECISFGKGVQANIYYAIATYSTEEG